MSYERPERPEQRSSNRLPTEKQRKLAENLAKGMTQKAAYMAAHPGTTPPFSSTISQACRSPEVQAELSRLRGEPIIQDRFDGAADARMIREHGIAGMMRLSRCVNEVVAFKANEWLVEYADQLENRKSIAPAIGGELLGDLRKLYGKALVAGEAIVEVVAEELPVKEIPNGTAD